MSKISQLGFLIDPFNPVQSGHLLTSLRALDTERLDRVLWIPADGLIDDPHDEAGMEDRWMMLVAVCSRDDRLIPFRPKASRNGSITPGDLFSSIRSSFPADDYFCVAGPAAASVLRRMHDCKKLLRGCTFLIDRHVTLGSSQALSFELGRIVAAGGACREISGVSAAKGDPEACSFLPSDPSGAGLSIPVREFCACKGLYGQSAKDDRFAPWIDRLFTALKPRRFAHSLSVAYTAKKLAGIHGLDALKAEQAGLLHDCSKCLPLSDMQRIARTYRLTDDPSVLESGALLHSVTGAYLAESEYDMTDPDVLEAIRYHNTGNPGMSRLAICVCLADSIEPLRESYPQLEQVRAMAGVSLERALLLSLECTARFVAEGGKYLHPRTRDTIRWLKALPATGL